MELVRDWVESGRDKVELACDRVELGRDRTELACDRVELGRDRVELGRDRTELACDRVELGRDRIELGLDRIALASDRVELGRGGVELACDRVELGRWVGSVTGCEAVAASVTSLLPVLKLILLSFKLACLQIFCFLEVALLWIQSFSFEAVCAKIPRVCSLIRFLSRIILGSIFHGHKMSVRPGFLIWDLRMPSTSCAGILEQSMGARNRVGIGLSYCLAESIPGLLKSFKIQLQNNWQILY